MAITDRDLAVLLCYCTIYLAVVFVPPFVSLPVILSIFTVLLSIKSDIIFLI